MLKTKKECANLSDQDLLMTIIFLLKKLIINIIQVKLI